MQLTIEEARAALIGASAALGAAVGGQVGAIVGAWQTQDVMTGQQVSEKTAYVNANCPDITERADWLTKAGALAQLLEGTG